MMPTFETLRRLIDNARAEEEKFGISNPDYGKVDWRDLAPCADAWEQCAKMRHATEQVLDANVAFMAGCWMMMEFSHRPNASGFGVAKALFQYAQLLGHSDAEEQLAAVPSDARERAGLSRLRSWLGRFLCKIGLHNWRVVRTYWTCYDLECSRCPAKDTDSILSI